tara:strand:- start:1598 stop:2269 length:672 start_codon:yes stop_codon:yes gene_type:complete
MSDIVKRLLLIKSEIKDLFVNNKIIKSEPNIIAVCKTFSMDKILPLIDIGHIHFGENKVQEAISKWLVVKKKHSNVKLHMVGKLQTNKVKLALQIFDYIHSLDNKKLAEKISKYEVELKKKTPLFIQVNLGNESQKSGINLEELSQFINYCKKDLSLNIIGLMCLPPLNKDPKIFFLKLNDIAKKNNLPHLSMGMTSDYLEAIRCGSTFLRIGSKIFGERKNN